MTLDVMSAWVGMILGPMLAVVEAIGRLLGLH